MVDMIKQESDSLWYYIFLIAEQFFGMKEGYALAAPADQVRCKQDLAGSEPSSL